MGKAAQKMSNQAMYLRALFSSGAMSFYQNSSIVFEMQNDVAKEVIIGLASFSVADNSKETLQQRKTEDKVTDASKRKVRQADSD